MAEGRAVARRREASSPTAAPRSTPGSEAGQGGRRPVAVVVSRFPKITETFILREIAELERQGQPVRLVPLLRHCDAVAHPETAPWVERALYTPFLDREILLENCRAFLESPLRYLGLLGRVLFGSVRSANLLWGTLGIFPKSVYIGRVLRKEGVGHLHAHFATHPAMAALVASAFSGIPWSFTAHAHDIFLARSRPMLGEKVRRAAFVRVISDYNRRFLERLYPGLGRYHVIHMGIDPEGYGPGAREPGRIVCVASLQPYKGISDLLEACRLPPLRDRSFRISIVGDGPLRSGLQERIETIGLQERVELLGPRTQSEVRGILSTASIFVHPSTVAEDGWMDGIPVALMEAMSAELPVVSTMVSGIPELVGHGEEGLLVPPGDPGALAGALADLLDRPDEARAMGRRSRRKVEREFHLEACVADLVRAFERHASAACGQGDLAVGGAFGTAAAGEEPARSGGRG